MNLEVVISAIAEEFRPVIPAKSYGSKAHRRRYGDASPLQIITSSSAIDIILLNLDLGRETGLEFLDGFRTVPFHRKVLLATADVNDSEVPELIRKGVSGIFMKHRARALLIQGIRETMNGKALLGQDLLRRALEQTQADGADRVRPKLSEREWQVLSSIS